MSCEIPCSMEEGLVQLSQFRMAGNKQRIFTWPIPHPSQPSAFCPCSRTVIKRFAFYFKATILQLILSLPFNQLSIWVLRKMGASIGEQVYLSAGISVDPLMPELLTIEDHVLLGVGVKITFHEFRKSEFVAGRVIIRSESVIGGFSFICPGIEIGEGATVAGGAVVIRDVPPGAIAIGNPARIIPGKK